MPKMTICNNASVVLHKRCKLHTCFSLLGERITHQLQQNRTVSCKLEEVLPKVIRDAILRPRLDEVPQHCQIFSLRFLDPRIYGTDSPVLQINFQFMLRVEINNELEFVISVHTRACQSIKILWCKIDEDRMENLESHKTCWLPP